MRGWIGYDLDGTLALYTVWKGVAHIGDPIPEMVEHCKNTVANGVVAKVFTARVSSVVPEADRIKAKEAIEQWCVTHIGQALEVTAEKDFHMIEYYDDRAITVEYNTGKIIRVE